MGQDNNIYSESISENDPADQTPGEQLPGDSGSTDPGEQPPEQDEGTDGNGPHPGDAADQDKEDKEDTSGDSSGGQEQPAGTPEDGTEEWQEEITERLTELMKPEDNTDVTERLDALIGLLTPEEIEEEPEPYAEVFAFEGYTEWDYPITMQFQVYPYGMGNWLRQTQTFNDPESFTVRYEEILGLCGEGGTLKDFYVEYIWDCNDEAVYDHEAQTPEPEPDPGDEEQEETVELLLSHLEGINTTLSEMIQTDTAYQTATMDCQQEMLVMQRLHTACGVILCVELFAIFIEMIWAEFFRRFR